MPQTFPFDNGYGHFSDDGCAYVITTPRTPRPWVNVISNGDFGVIVSQAGGGYTWRTDAQLNRITRWEQDLIKDEWGKYIYLRDAETGEFWSAAWKPVCVEPEQYRCTHGLGYTLIESRTKGVDSIWLMTVPRKDPVELWKLTLRNSSGRRRRLQVFTYFEWNLGAAPDWHREFHRSFIKTEYADPWNALVATKRLWEVPSDKGAWNRDWEFVAFHGCNRTPKSYDGDKESFLGAYEHQRNPKAVREGTLGRNTGDGLDAVASLQLELDLEPGQSDSVVFTLGAVQRRSEVARLTSAYATPQSVDEALKDVKEMWRDLLGRSGVRTPDESMNLLLNTWLKYQAISGRMWGRTGYYQTGGAFGFRDQLQDSQIFLPLQPDRTADQIRLHARHQFRNGTVYHWWHPLSEVGLPTNITDDLLWLPYLVSEYLTETGDTRLLRAREPFLDDPKSASIYDHCLRAIDKTLSRMSKRGIPLIGAGDWNDGLSAVGLRWKGESVWLGQFLHRILLDFAEVAEWMGDDKRAAVLQLRARKLRKDLNKHAWDGAYYYGATKDSGERLGSARSVQSKVWLNTQTWAVLGDVADAARASAVMDVVERRLEGNYGTLLVAPAYSKPDPEIGYLTRYAPGMRENGGVYTHAATWSVLAAAKLGRAETAYRFFSKINPIRLGSRPNEYYAEPYVTPGNIEGPGSRFYGRGGWSWYSGSAAWLFRAGLEGILGVRATKSGLAVDPCIPSSWEGYRVHRKFRGTDYDIVVENPGHVSTGVAEAYLDGMRVTADASMRGIVLPLTRRRECAVRIVLGPRKKKGHV